MENIFLKEEQVVIEAEELLESGKLDTENDISHYKALLDEYKKLLRQTVTLIKVSDLNQAELNALSKRLQVVSNTDELTDLYNRRYFNEVYHKEWLSAVRSKTCLAAIMIDIDFFKIYNDAYGHLRGDKCLKSVADAIRKSTSRPRDIVARFGGEEFVVLLPETDVEGAIQVSKKIMAYIEELSIKNSKAPSYGNITVSIGVAALVPDKNDLSVSLLNMSDKALYHAKEEGRNCYRVYEEDLCQL